MRTANKNCNPSVGSYISADSVSDCLLVLKLADLGASEPVKVHGVNVRTQPILQCGPASIILLRSHHRSLYIISSHMCNLNYEFYPVLVSWNDVTVTNSHEFIIFFELMSYCLLVVLTIYSLFE